MTSQLTPSKVRHLSIELASAEYLGLSQDALRAPAPLTPLHTRIFLSLAKKSAYNNLSTGKLSVFDDIRNGRLTPPCIFIENMPIDERLPPTPSDGRWCAAKQTYISEFVLAGIMQLLGIPFCLQGEKDGFLWSQNVAAEGKENERSSLGAKVKLGFHTELVALTEHGLRCDWLGLICLRPDPKQEAITRVADVRDVLRSLTSQEIEILSQPLFQYKIPNSFASNAAFSNAMPLLTGSNPPQMNINFSTGMYSFVDDNIEAMSAFEHFDLVLETADVVREFKLQTGNLLIVNNVWAAHGRSDFDPIFDGTGRWLQRMYVRNELFTARNRAVQSKYLTFD